MRAEVTITDIVTGGHFVEGDDDKTLLAHEEVGLCRGMAPMGKSEAIRGI